MKIYANRISNRIKYILKDIINSSQTGGLVDRNIYENLSIIKSIILHSEHDNGAIISLDFEKAHGTGAIGNYYMILCKLLIFL